MKHVIVALCLLLSSAAAWAQDGDHRVVVGFNGAPDETVFAQHGGQLIKTIKGSNAVVGTLSVGKIEKLKALANVSYVEPDAVASIVQGHASGKPGGGGGTPPPQLVPWGVSKIGAQGLSYKGGGIIVGIVDTGIDATHPDLPAGSIVGGINTVRDNLNYADDNSHGTHVAGTIAANDNSIGVVGVAPEVKLFIAKSLNRNGSGTYADLIEGFNACVTAGARVISMSWGGNSGSQLMADAIDAAHTADVVLVAAAGNSGNSVAIGYPAAYPKVLAVGATDSTDLLASFSSAAPNLATGKDKVDLLAPGVAVRSTVPGGYATWDGTSMATPHVSATAALVIQSKGFTQKSDVEARLKTTAVPVAAGNRVSASAATGSP